jgi:iron complex outermembrane recepter protein
MTAQNSTRVRMFRRSLLAVACAAAATPTFAQTVAAPTAAASAPASEMQRVEVTGSRLKQIDTETSSPVQVITREDIVHTGATTVREMLDSLSATSTSGTLSDIGGSNSFAPGASGASLRNLGKQSTLVLLNGRRLPAYPLADFNEVFTNVDSLPLAVIDRIEVLKDGASAIYGSDAVAGVINIITRSTFQGAQVDYSAERSIKNKLFGDRSGGLTVGFGNYAADGFNIMGNIEMYNRDEVLWNKVLKDVNPAYGAHSGSFGTKSSYSYPGNIISDTDVPSYAVAGCTDIEGGLCRYDRYSRFEAVPATKRINSFFSAKKRISDTLEWFSELTYSDIRASYQDAYQIYGGESAGDLVWCNPTTGAPETFYYRDIPATNPLNTTGAPADFRYRFVDGPSYQTTDSSQYRVLTGLKGTTGAFDWESAVGVMGGTTVNTQRGSFSNSGFIKEIGDYGQPDSNGFLPDVPANFFNIPGGYQPGGTNTAAVLNTLFPTYGYQAHDQTYFIDGTARTDLFQLPAGAVQLATGFDLRHEQMVITPSANLADGDIVGYGTSESNASRNFGAIYAEAGIPILKTLDGTLAGRLDKFPGFGAHFSPKVGLKFKPIDQALFRGTFETGFRAPNLTESAASTKFAFAPLSNGDPDRCSQANNYANDLYNQGAALPASDPNQALLEARAQTIYDNECARSVASKTTNNPALKPETTKSFTFGTVLQATSLWSTSIDYWKIHRKDEIGTRSGDDLLAAESTLPPGIVNRAPSFANDPSFSHDPNGLTDAQVRAKYGVGDNQTYLESIDTPFQNLFQTKTDGVDIGVKGSVPTSIGSFGLEIDTTYTHSYRVFSPTLNSFGDNLAGRYGFPKIVANTTVSYKVGDFDQSLRYVFNSSTALQGDYYDTEWNTAGCAANGLSASECRIHTYHRVDYSVSWTGIKNLTLGVFIGNLLGHRPPVDYKAFGVPAGVIPVSNEDAEGRMGKVSLSYKWL